MNVTKSATGYTCEDLRGTPGVPKFGQLEPLEPTSPTSGTRKHGAWWLCRCHQCGGTCKVSAHQLKEFKKKTCGCKKPTRNFDTLMVDIDGETLSVTEWLKRKNMPVSTMRKRLGSGMSARNAIRLSYPAPSA